MVFVATILMTTATLVRPSSALPNFKNMTTITGHTTTTASAIGDLHLPSSSSIQKKRNGLMHDVYDAHMKNNIGRGGGRRLISFSNGETVVDLDEVLHLGWKDNRLLVEITTSSTNAVVDMLPDLEEYGFEVTACNDYTCSGYLDIAVFPAVEDLSTVQFIMPSMRSTQSSASKNTGVLSQAINALQVDKVRSAYPHLDGEGMTVGILSDSYNTRGGASADIENGELPSDGVRVLREFSSGRGFDEGRAMAQLIHDIAPNATLVFRTAVEGTVDFANGIQELADAGCDVIVDDVSKSILLCVVVLMFMLSSLSSPIVYTTMIDWFHQSYLENRTSRKGLLPNRRAMLLNSVLYHTLRRQEMKDSNHGKVNMQVLNACLITFRVMILVTAKSHNALKSLKRHYSSYNGTNRMHPSVVHRPVLRMTLIY
jgi:hypothetical protein